MDSIQDSTRYVVSGTHHGGVLPGARKEMWREVYLLPGADVRGGLWCGSLAVSGRGVSVGKSVYCRGAATINADDDKGKGDGDVTFGSCFTCRDSLTVGKVPFRVRFLSDIYANRLNLNHAVVYGNIYAREVILHESLVLGGVFCRGRLQAESSLMGTFHTGEANLGKGVSLLFPSAVARESLEVTAPVRILTFMNLMKRGKRGDVGAAVSLDRGDVLSLKPPAGHEAAGDTVHCLSLTDRILDSDALYRHLQVNRKLVEHLTLGDHLAPEIQESEINTPRAELESSLWKTMLSKAAPSRKKKLPLEDLCRRLNLS